HPRTAGAAGADRACAAAARARRSAVAAQGGRRADGSRLRLPEPDRAARARPLASGGGVFRRASLRGERRALPPRHRLQRMRAGARVPLQRAGAGAVRGAARHALPRRRARPRAERGVREVPAMIGAAALAGLSAVLGGAIALIARRSPGVLERIRTFAFAAAAGVVAFHLLPEILPEQGLLALLWIALGFALPWGLEWAARTVGPGLLRGRGLSGLRVSAEVGFAALVFHSLVEGLALVAALAQPGGNVDLQIAIVAHHAPLTAAVVLPFLDLGGARAAAIRAALIALAGVGGALLSGALPGFHEDGFIRVATAITAGALLHVVSDEIRAQRFGSRLERTLDLGACIAGLGVAGAGALVHLREEAAPLLELCRVAAGIALVAAPPLLAGGVASALLASRTRFF